MALRQESRYVAVATPMGEDTLVLLSMTATERLSRLFTYELEMLSEDPALNLDDLLGQNVTVRLERTDVDECRFFNGFVSRCSLAGPAGRHTRYQATLRPWLWFLTRTADCRIFQEMTVPDIIKQVFRDHGLTDFKDSLFETYRSWENCVQYRETDFNFVSRLMEQEGIYYYFEHENGKHTLVLADGYSSHAPVPGHESVPFFPPDAGQGREREHVFDWRLSREVRPGAFAVADFDFEAPKKVLRSRSSITREHQQAGFELYDYPGEYTDPAHGDIYARIRMEEQQSRYEIGTAEANTRGMLSGGLFKLQDHPNASQNREYLVVAASFEVYSDAYQNDMGQAGKEAFSCSLEVIDARTPWRPERLTPKPLIQGPQTAIVTGPSGEEIHTDKHGRVKLQFHWDRYGKADDTSSAWTRVAQLMAGKSWGGMWLPRVGQEVVVEFLEGDPDRPLVTGRVYNGDNKTPYKLPAEKTKSTVKSNSSKGGGGFNELRFEDKTGEEQVFLHAQKNLDLRVLESRFETIGKDRHLGVDNDKLEHIKNDRHETVDNHHHEKIGGDRNLDVGGKEAVAIKASKSLKVDGKVHEVFGDDQGTQVAGDRYLKAANVVIEGSDNITLKVGGSFIAIDKTGVKISGGQVAIEANTKLVAKAGATLEAEGGASFKISGPMGTVEGSAMLTVKGGMVMIN